MAVAEIAAPLPIDKLQPASDRWEQRAKLQVLLANHRAMADTDDVDALCDLERQIAATPPAGPAEVLALLDWLTEQIKAECTDPEAHDIAVKLGALAGIRAMLAAPVPA